MAQQLLLSATTGLTATAQLYSGTSPVGSPIPYVEIGTTGQYVADIPAGLAFGTYNVIASSAGNVLGSEQLFWDGTYILPIGLAMLQGLDSANPMTVTPISRVTGGISLTIAGDGENISIVSR